MFPPARWLRSYRLPDVRRDLLAGVTLAAYAVPVSLAYAALAGLPPRAGIVCYLAGGLLYAMFGTSRFLAIGPTSAISLLIATTAGALAEGDPARWAALASLAALEVAVICFVAWLFRLSVLVNFISETILLGFKAGAALIIALTQLPQLLGVPGGGEHFLERLFILAGQIRDINPYVLGFGVGVLALLFLGERLWPGRPVALVVVALSILAASLLPLEEHGIALVGALPAGAPRLALPALHLMDLNAIIPLAFACFLLSYIESVTAARAFASERGEEIDPHQELLGLGAANLGAALTQGYPVAGGLSQTAVNEKAGARTPLSLVFASVTLAICLLFLTGLLRNLPAVVLAAIVVVSVLGLIDLAEMRHVWRVSRVEFGIALAALAGVLLLGILNGVLFAVLVSLLTLLAETAAPHVAFLGRIPGTRRYTDLERHPDNEVIPGVLVCRVEAAILYFNVEHVRRAVLQRVGTTAPLALLVCDLSNSPFVDVSGARMLAGLHETLAARGVLLRVAEAHARVRDILRAEGLEDRIGPIKRFTSVDDVIRRFEADGEV